MLRVVAQLFRCISVLTQYAGPLFTLGLDLIIFLILVSFCYILFYCAWSRFACEVNLFRPSGAWLLDYCGAGVYVSAV